MINGILRKHIPQAHSHSHVKVLFKGRKWINSIRLLQRIVYNGFSCHVFVKLEDIDFIYCEIFE